MRKGFSFIVSLFALLVALAACDGPAAPGGPSAAQPSAVAVAGTPEAGARGTPRAGGTRPPNFTPPANFTPGGQRPGAQNTPRAAVTAAPTLAAPTAVVATAITNTTGIAPTAVPIPQVVIPTAVPPSAPTLTPTPPPTQAPAAGGGATATPAPLTPELLRGKIVFSSDRDSPYPQLYVMEPDGTNVRLCTCVELLETMVTNEYTSPDKKQFLFVKQTGSPRSGIDFQIWSHNNETNEDKRVTGAAPGFPGVDYDPVWSPDSKHVAWVTEANGFDEIYLYDATTNENVRLTQSSAEWYKHPSFSPDGSQIVFWSNRADANFKQIWVMNLDGSNLRNLSRNQYNDFDPIWVK